MTQSCQGAVVSKLAILLLPEYSQLGLAAVIEPLFIANWLAGRDVHAWTTLSVDGRPVRASSGVTMPVDGDLAAGLSCATVLVLASFDPLAAIRHRPALAWLRRMARSGAEIGGIENGSLLLAEAGLLDGREAAVHWDNQAGFQELYPRVRTVDQLYVRSGACLTCAGAAAVLDLMIAWIGWHSEPALADEVAGHLLLTGRCTVGHSATAPDAKVAAAQAIMRAHLEEPLPCGEIAARVGLSLRQLERRFLRQCGRSIVQDYLTLRLSRAHQLLQQTGLEVIDISLACGFASPAYFARAYRRTFGCPPSADRRQSVDAPAFRATRVHPLT